MIWANRKLELKLTPIKNDYRRCAIITRDLYTFYLLFEVKKRFFKGLFFLKFWPYVWLVVSNQEQVIVAHVRYM